MRLEGANDHGQPVPSGFFRENTCWRELESRLRNRLTMANPTGRGGFKKGKSGNPGGRPRALASVMHEARRHTPEALKTLLKLMRTGEPDSVRLNAAEALLSRGWGKPIQAVQVDGRFVTKKLADMTPDEIRDFDERIEMIEAEQPDMLTLTHENEKEIR